ncbi:MAG: HD domain-containing phosphohydrolase [Spirochaetia bacterium]|nr:HD domain-containing protein [Spirochaetota bacterium]MDW8112050.1 HD domain-containing phosphohydrolase [Spirochaetia bacterium]
MIEILLACFINYSVFTIYSLLITLVERKKLLGFLQELSIFLIFISLLMATLLKILNLQVFLYDLLIYLSAFLSLIILNIRLADYIRTKKFYKYKTINLLRLLLVYSSVAAVILVVVSIVFLDDLSFKNLLIVLIILASSISIFSIIYLKITNEISRLKIFEDLSLIIPLLVSVVLDLYRVDSEIFISFIPFSISPILRSVVSSISPLSYNQEIRVKILALFLSASLTVLPILYISIISLVNLYASHQLLVISSFFVLMLSALISVVIYKLILNKINDVLTKFVRMNISSIREEEVSSLTVGELVNRLQKFIERFFGRNIVELYTFSSFEKTLNPFVVLDGDKGFVESAKNFKLTDKDLNILVSRFHKFFTKDNVESPEFFKKSDNDILIPITYQGELKFVLTIRLSDRFEINRAVKTFLSEIFHLLLLETQSVITRELAIDSQYSALLFIKDTDLRQEITTSLLINNFNVFSVNNYYEALKVLEKMDIDLLICDNEVDNKSGISLIRNIESIPTKSHIFSVLLFYDFNEETSRETLETFSDIQMMVKNDFLYINNMISYVISNLIAKKRIEKTFKNITSLSLHSTVLLDKILGYKTTSFDDVEIEIISKLLLQPDVNTPSFLAIGEIKRTYIRSKVFAILQGRQITYLDTVDIPIEFYSRKKFGRNKVIYSDYVEEGIPPREFSNLISKEISSIVNPIYNFLAVSTEDSAIISINYSSRISSWDIDLMRSLLVNYLLMKAIYEEVKEVDNAFVYTMQSLARAAEEMDEETGFHIYRVGEYSKMLSKYLGFSDEFCNSIYYASQMHDIGKLKIPREILRKPGILTPEEFEIMKEHTIAGAIILGDHQKLSMAKDIALSHHERWDGSGYPYGLEKDKIPISARIVAISDVYDALRSPRTYKPEFEHEKAVKIIIEGDGRTKPSHFDPDILQAFKELHHKFEEIYRKYKE